MTEALKADSPIYVTMQKIVHSPAGITAAVLATNRGEPALSGVDPLLKSALGGDYNRDNWGTANAGFLIAGLMRTMGFTEAGYGKCVDCVADNGLIWKPDPDLPTAAL